jgi:hypothetical protein
VFGNSGHRVEQFSTGLDRPSEIGSEIGYEIGYKGSARKDRVLSNCASASLRLRP